MNTITPAQIKKLSTLLTQQHLGSEIKDSLVFQFTNGRTVSRKEMTVDEGAALINELSKNDPCRKMRNKIFAIAHDLGWLYKGMHELNARIIDKFLERHGAVKGSLNRMNQMELVRVVTQFEVLQGKAESRTQEQAIADILTELGINRQAEGPAG